MVQEAYKDTVAVGIRQLEKGDLFQYLVLLGFRVFSGHHILLRYMLR